MLKVKFDDAPAVSNNDKLLAKFHSGTLRMMDTLRPMWVF